DCVGACGYEGVEFRGLQGEMFLPDAPPLAPAKRGPLRRRFEDLGCRIACVSSSASFTAAESEVRQRRLDEVRAYADLASDLGAGLIRVFGGQIPEGVSRSECIKYAGEALRQAAEIAAQHGAKVALETHDAFSRGREAAELVAAADHPACGSLWDVHHPYRQGESIEESLQALGETLLHVHVKDGVRDEGKVQYRLLGEGTVPVREALRGLKALGYDGYLSLEWEKAWHTDLPEPEVVFPHFADAMRTWLAELD
ncbi:MAG: sugar phosphate isomerase/epimerase family protein, partial [Armatimonadota bacterium]